MRITRSTIDPHDTPVKIIERHAQDILMSAGMREEARCIQHGTTSVLAHSAQVTACSLVVARELGLPVDERALTRGALLHDYFLYDWHRPHPDNVAHGFTHPFTACRNAKRDFNLSPLECGIIRTHMFPLVPLPPASHEALLVCLVDKACALAETLRRANR